MIVSDPTSAAPDRTDAARVSSPVGLHRVLEPTGDAITLPAGGPSASTRARSCGPTRCASPSRRSTSTRRATASWPRSTRRRRLDGGAVRAEVLDIVATRGKMQNPVTGSGGMLIGTVDRGRAGAPLGLAVGDRVATLVSLSLTPLRHHRRPGRLGRALRAGAGGGPRHPLRPQHRRPRCPTTSTRPGPHGHGRVRRARARRAGRGGVRRARRRADRGRARRRRQVGLAVARRRPRRGRRPHASASCPVEREASCSRRAGSPTRSSSPTPAHRWGSRMPSRPPGGPADVTVVCVDVPGCEQPAILATAQGGTIIFFTHGHELLRRRARGRGARRRRADARRQRLRARPRRPGAATSLREVPAVRALFEGRLAAEKAGSDA